MSPYSKGLIALALGASGGLVFIALGMSLPWVLGSMTACAIVSLSGYQLKIPNLWRSSALATVGIILGGSFDQSTLEALPSWSISIGFMLLLTLGYFFFSLLILSRWSNMSRLTTLFAAVPGGLAIVSAISEMYNADTRRIALSHSARLVALLILVPFILRWAADHTLPPSTLPDFHIATDSQAFIGYGVLILCGVCGIALAHLLRFPTGVLLFPIIFSAVAHGSGLISTQVPAAIAALAQAVLGSSIGVRFAGYRWRDIFYDGWLSIIIGVLLALLAMLAALIVSGLFGLSFAPLLLVFLPGGAPEIGVMALALSIDPAMVASHHMLRLLALIGGISWVLSRYLPTQPNQQ